MMPECRIGQKLVGIFDITRLTFNIGTPCGARFLQLTARNNTHFNDTTVRGVTLHPHAAISRLYI